MFVSSNFYSAWIVSYNNLSQYKKKSEFFTSIRAFYSIVHNLTARAFTC